eukprot:13031745-Heterocapsa_arctica.AAC.1
MWEWWNHTSIADKARVGSWRHILQSAIEQAESKRSSKADIPATVIDRAYAFIDIQSDCSTKENGMIEKEINKAKILAELVNAETAAKGVFLNGVGQAPSPSGKPPKQHIFEIFRKTIPQNHPSRRSSREGLWSTPAPAQMDHQLAALRRYSTEVIKDQDTSFPIPDIDTIY